MKEHDYIPAVRIDGYNTSLDASLGQASFANMISVMASFNHRRHNLLANNIIRRFYSCTSSGAAPLLSP